MTIFCLPEVVTISDNQCTTFYHSLYHVVVRQASDVGRAAPNGQYKQATAALCLSLSLPSILRRSTNFVGAWLCKSDQLLVWAPLSY